MTRARPDLYDARFSEREISAKDGVWREIVRYIDRWIDPGASSPRCCLRPGTFHSLGDGLRTVGDGYPRRVSIAPH